MSKHNRERRAVYRDLYLLQEDQRITEIGRACSQRKEDGSWPIVGVTTDCGPGDEDKADRYIRKVITLYPQVRMLDRTPGPVDNVVTIRFQWKS